RFLTEIFLRVQKLLSSLVYFLVTAVRLQDMCLYIIGQLHMKDVFHLFFQSFILYRENNLHSLIQISGHPVRTAHKEYLIAVVIEIENPAVLQEISYNGTHRDIFTDSRDPCFQAADTTDDQVDLHPGCAGSVQSRNDIPVAQ